MTAVPSTARLRAIGAELLSAGKWQTTSLRSPAQITLEPYVGRGKGNVSLLGPDVTLDARAVATLGMAFHELATNTGQHGALSSREGRVEQNGGDKRLLISWRENGGPATAEPPNDGFGTSFVKRSIAYELKGTVDMSFEPDEFRAVIAFPLQEGAAAT